MSKSISIRSLLVTFFVLSIIFTAQSAMCKDNVLKVGEYVKDFTLPAGLTEGEINFEKDIKGKSNITIISFMTTSCSACMAEMSLLSGLTNKHSDKIKLYAISVDLNGASTVPAYNKRFGFSATYMLDPDFEIPQLFGFTYTPSVVIIDKSGKIIYLKGGYSPTIDSDSIANAVENALKN